MITSFSNPNYTLNDADALNSNLPPVYDNSTTTLGNGSTTKSRQKYAHMDLATMGMTGNTVLSPDSALESPEPGKADSPTTAEDDSEIANSPADDCCSEEVVNNPAEEPDEAVSSPADYSQHMGGFLGYYASLELSAKAHEDKATTENNR